MNLLKQGKTNWKYILIVVVLAIIVGGGTLWYVKKQGVSPHEFIEIEKPEEATKLKIKLLENIVSSKLTVVPEEYLKNLESVSLSLEDLNVQHFSFRSLGNPSQKYPYYLGVDGGEVQPYNRIFFAGPKSRINFIINSQPIYQIALREKDWFLLENGKEKRLPYENISNFAYTPDDKNIAFIASKEGKQFLILNGREKEIPYDMVLPSLTFSPDGNHLAYVAKKDGQTLVIIDENVVKVYTNIEFDTGTFVFSPDSKHFAYQAYYKTFRDHFIVLDGNELKPKELINCCQSIGWGPFFTSDSKHVIYTVKDNNGREFVVRDEKVISSKSYFDIVWLNISPTDEVVYVAKPEADQKEVLIIGEKETQINYEIISIPTFSPDGKHLAYVISREGKNYIIVDDKESKGYDRILPPFYSLYFSSDSQYLGYVALINNELWWIVDKVE
jgi:hypothetical protein